jgi:oligosaccharide repeat unit polymerase
MFTISLITLIIYLFLLTYFICKSGVYSASSIFLLCLGFFQVGRLVFVVFPDLESYIREDYTLHSSLILISVVFFTAGKEIYIKNKYIKSNNVQRNNSDDRFFFDIGKIIIYIFFIPSLITAFQSLFSPSLGSYGIEEGSPSPFQKVSLYASLIGLQMLNASNLSLSREYILLICLVSIPRFVISIIGNRSIFLFFLLAELSVLVQNNKITQKIIPKISIFVIIILPIMIFLPLTLRSNLSIDLIIENFLQTLYSFSDPIDVITLAVENINNIPEIFYSFSSIIGIYFSFLPLEDYVILPNDNPIGEGIMVNRLDRALSKYLLWDKGMLFAGTGGNYLADLYLDFSFFGVAIGSLFLGIIVRVFENNLNRNKLILFLSFYFFQKLFYLPRGTYTELFDMLPIYTLIFIVFLLIRKILKKTYIIK